MDGVAHVIASVRPDEPRPAWTRELPVRITPPLERPQSPVGSVSLTGTEEARKAGRVYLGILVFTSVAFLLLAIVWTWQLTGTLEFTPGGTVLPSYTFRMLKFYLWEGVFDQETALKSWQVYLDMVIYLFVFKNAKDKVEDDVKLKLIIPGRERPTTHGT